MSLSRGKLRGLVVVAAALCLPLTMFTTEGAVASDPTSSTITPPPDEKGVPHSTTSTWTGNIPMTGVLISDQPCTPAQCDEHTVHLQVPAGYWKTHDGSVKVSVAWESADWDLDVRVLDADGNLVGDAGTADIPEQVDLGELAPGDYTVQVTSYIAQPSIDYTASVTLSSTLLDPAMTLPEDKESLMDELTVHYPLRVVFVGRKPSAAEVAELRDNIPDTYQPTVATKSPSATADPSPAGAGDLVNWNTVHYGPRQNPYFLGLRYKYDLQILTASDDYAKALYQVAEDHTAQGQSLHDDSMTAQQVKYDATYGKYRLRAKGGDPSYAVTDPSKDDLVDSFAVEDWMFDSRTDDKWDCAFTDAETGDCVPAGVIQDTRDSYHDPYYDKFGKNLDKMPQGVSKGSSYFFFDTFTPAYAKDYFRPNAYHTWTTDKVIDGAIIDKSVDEGGSWRITDPDTGSWAGVDFARTWGGRYRFHFFDLGAAPNSYEDATWANYGAAMSNEYPMGDPPVWQYDSDPLWQQTSDDCRDQAGTHYTGNTPCRIMPRLARDVAYGLFFRSTAGYLYRPIPRGDVYWLATTNWTDFYSRPQWVKGAPVGAPYGTWWSDMSKLFQIDDDDHGDTTVKHDDTLRWLSSATPYTRWVGRKGQVIPLYDPETNQPNGKTLDTSPKYADLPAPEYHVHSSALGRQLLPEPLYGGEHVIQTEGDGAKVDLTELSNQFEKAKAAGIVGLGYDDSVNTDIIRDYIDAHRAGIADRVPGVGTIPSVNMVFEKAYTWALPAIVGGIALDDGHGESWGVFNNVNDRFKWCGANYPVYNPAVNQPGDKVSLAPCHPKQNTGTGFSYTIEHEAAHSLGLSHPHDGSYGVDKCPADSPNAGKWMCYWSGLGWVMDISAAPTTYASAYRPYEVEDQDNLQRGHVAEYLLAGQTSLSTALIAESAANRTTPSDEFNRRYDAYKAWKAQAVTLLRGGDNLHAEYAARNAAIAAKGVVQTAANTTDPRLLGAGQVFYFNVHPQSTLGLAKRANLQVNDLTVTQTRPRVSVVTADVTNDSKKDATGVLVQVKDGSSVIGTPVVGTIPAGESRTVTLSWDTAYLAGSRTLTATADPLDTVAEEDESDNTLTRQVVVRGNLAPNGSFEIGAGRPVSWTPGSGTSYLVNDQHAVDGYDLVAVSAARLGNRPTRSSTWTSSAFQVQPGAAYQMAMNVAGTGLSGHAYLVVEYLDAKGRQIGSTDIRSLRGTFAARDFLGSTLAPAKAVQARIVLQGFEDRDKRPNGTVYFDGIWFW